MIYGKVWGTTRPLLVTPMVEVHEIHIEPRSASSIHKHAHKWNGFYVVSGAVEIHVEKNDYELVDVTRLEAGGFTTVRPGENHWFETDDGPAHVIEIYYPMPLSEDIIRKTVGTTQNRKVRKRRRS